MCKADTPKPTPTPPQPEAVKRVEAEVAQARNNAKSAAAKRYGVAGTNVTGGALATETAETKKTKLGGA
jgi:hypothetical protein